MQGAYCRLEALNVDRHAADLHAANGTDKKGRIWTYLGYGPFATLEAYVEWIEQSALGDDPLFFAVIDQERDSATGVTSYLRIVVEHGCIEVGHINYSPLLQKTRAATEAMYLMMKTVFDLGYRRYEWKCDALNAASRKAALRLGFSFEGVFRQAVVTKGRNRDTAWYAMTDKDWQSLRPVFAEWLSPKNFDLAGNQRMSLSALTLPLLVHRG